jgi:hypothetical protein
LILCRFKTNINLFSTGIFEADSALDDADENGEDWHKQNGEDLSAKGGRMGQTAEAEDQLDIIASPFPMGGKPFSALNRQLVPKYFEQPEELFVPFS